MRNLIDIFEGDWKKTEQLDDKLLRLMSGLQSLAFEVSKIDKKLSDPIYDTIDELDKMYRVEEAKIEARRAENERLDREEFGDDFE